MKCYINKLKRYIGKNGFFAVVMIRRNLIVMYIIFASNIEMRNEHIHEPYFLTNTSVD